MSARVVKVGIIGAGEVAQVVHIPTLCYLPEFFQISYICDNSKDTLNFVKNRVSSFNRNLKITTDPTELCTSPDVDVVMVLTADEYHVEYAVLALKSGKVAFIEKPMALTKEDAELIIETEKKHKGVTFVGTMRRYAPAFELAIKEIGGVENIQYMRVRDIIGPNSTFVDQSGTFPQRFSDYSVLDTTEKKQRGDLLVKKALQESGISDYDTQEVTGWRFLGGLGSHDLSLMREVIGLPKGYIGAKINLPYINALLDYGNFVVSYESGIHEVSEFDSHLEIYSATKIVKVQYDTPYIKGLPITLQVREDVKGHYVSKIVRPTYEDPYTIQAKKLYEVVVNGAKHKTTAQDSIEDLEIFKGIVRASNEYALKTRK